MLPGLRLHRLHPAVVERLLDLLVQVHPVGHQHNLGRSIAASSASAFASITIVSDLPDPCVCQTTPPCRRPSAPTFRTRSTMLFTVKYCWYRAIFFSPASYTMNRQASSSSRSGRHRQ